MNADSNIESKVAAKTYELDKVVTTAKGTQQLIKDAPLVSV